jgi:endogenous inhibitor of DNA gyrase (YacG/DUF329 family)
MVDLDNWLSGRYRISTPLSGRSGGTEEDRHPETTPEAKIE